MGTGTEAYGRTLASTSKRHIARLYKKANKAGPPVRKSRQTQRLVIAGRISTDLTQNPLMEHGTKVEGNTLGSTSRQNIARLYKNSNKWDAGRKSRERRFPVVAGGISTDFTQNRYIGARYGIRGKRTDQY